MTRKPSSLPVRAGPEKARRRDLTREKLVIAAIALLDAGGVGALSIRALADAVGVTPMAIYNHFDSKNALLVAVADGIVGSAEFDGGYLDWRRQLHHCFTVLRGLCLRHPALPALLEQDRAIPASASEPMQVTVQALHAAGMSEIDAQRTFFLLLGYTLSQTAYQARPIPGLDLLRRDASYELPAWDFDESFRFGLGLVLDGIDTALSARSDATGNRRA